MRELKEIELGEAYKVFDDDKEFYLKYEVDKVIAEKDAEIEKLKAIRKVHVEAIESMGAGLQQDEEEILHQKYKRCLAMAMWCDSEANYWYDSSKVHQCCRYGHYISWFNKWSKLAEKFKPNKEAK